MRVCSFLYLPRGIRPDEGEARFSAALGQFRDKGQGRFFHFAALFNDDVANCKDQSFTCTLAESSTEDTFRNLHQSLFDLREMQRELESA